MCGVGGGGVFTEDLRYLLLINFFALQFAVEAGFNVPVSIVPPLKVQGKVHVKKKTTPPKAATRSMRAPVYFKCVRVKYDKENKRLKLKKGEFVGIRTRDIGDEEDKEYSETTLACEDEEGDLAGTTYASTYPIVPICSLAHFAPSRILKTRSAI